MSNRLLSNVAIFTVGAAIGSAVTWIFLKKRYEQIAQEEIDSVKEAFLDQKEEVETKEQITNDYADIVKSYVPVYSGRYPWGADHNSFDAEKPGPKKVDRVEPYVITPETYGDGDYEMVALTYYADGVLADFNDYIIKDIEDVVGDEAISHIGEYQDDVVHVRDENKKVDYEIVRDPRKYIDAVAKVTPFSEVE